jgi:hypothetical protein
LTYEELIWSLRRIPALIVHFSHHAKMREDGTFPEDLLASALNSGLWPLSCCLVWPDHKMNLPGSIGVVLRPRSLSSIVSVGSDDTASMSFDWQEGTLGAHLTAEELKQSMEVQSGNYNEWRVRDCDVVGVYVEEPLQAKKAGPQFDPDDNYLVQDIALETIQPEELYRNFADLPIITRSGDRKRFVAIHVPVSLLYG